MKQSQIGKTEMMQDTNEYLDVHTAVWSSVPVIATYKLRLAATLQGIKTAALEQEAAQVFIGASLAQVKRLVAIKLDILDDGLTAYAEDTENAELISKANNSTSDYYRLPHEEFEVKAKNMISLLTSHADSLGDYGLTVEQIDDAKLSFDGFQEKRGKPRSYQIASKVATQSIDDLMKEATKVLDRLDKVMKRYKRSNPAFYNGYLAARTIVNH